MLAHRDYQVQDLVGKLKLLQKLVFYQQMKLRQGHLVRRRCSATDERSAFFSLDVDPLTCFLEDGSVHF